MRLTAPLWPAIALIAPLGFAAACSQPEAVVGCEPTDGILPICGFLNPEDLAALPGGAWIAISQFGAEGKPGSLIAFRDSDAARRILYPHPEVDLGGGQKLEGWGDPACPGPPDAASFTPHGIDVSATSNRPPVLAAVNHGGREAIELFEIGYADGGPALAWRGCVPLPENVWPNDVALLSDGSLMTTDMFAPPDDLEGWMDIVRIFTGSNTGQVLAWRADTGWVPVPGSEGATPNGIAVSPDGRELYFAEWSAQHVVRVRLDAGDDSRRSSIDVPHLPDNLTWTRDGQLLVTGQAPPLGDALGCGQLESGTCALGFSVIRVDPATLESQLVFSHDGTTMGAGTVALEVGDELLIGTFAGDRIARVGYKH